MSFKQLFIAFSFFFPVLLFAQKSEISGRIVDAETNEPLAGASVTVVTQKTKAYIRGQQTSEDGSFSIQGLDASTYSLEVSMLGYDAYLMDTLVITAGKSRNLDVIRLEKESEVIDEVVVKGGSPNFRIGIDKKVFDVSKCLKINSD